MKNLLFLLFAIFAFAVVTAQDKVILTSKKVLAGKITLVSETQINISTPSRDYECPVTQVDCYEKDGKIFTPENSSGQYSVVTESAGDELMKTAGLFTAGALITTAGFIMTNFASDFIKVGSNDSQEDIDNKVLHIKHLRYFGAGCFVLGSILEISAIIPISAAGKKLNFFMKNDSAGVSMKF